MRKILPVLILLLIPINIIFAQGSPFGSLNNGDKNETDAVEMQGQQVTDYVEAMAQYTDILNMYEKAYGSQKTVLEEQLIARSKDALYSKLGAIETYLDALIKNAEFYKQIDSDDKKTLEIKLGDYRNTMSEYAKRVENAENMAEIRVVSEDFNAYLKGFLHIKNKHISRVSAVRGLEIIGVAMDEIDLMRFHLDSASSLGHDTHLTQTKFDSAMLTLEKSKDVYLEVQNGTESLNILDETNTSTYVSRIISTNRDVIKAHEDLKEVIVDLRQFFGHSPWKVDFERGESMVSMDKELLDEDESLDSMEETSNE